MQRAATNPGGELRKSSKGFSDHFPILVDFEMRKSAPPKKEKFIMKRSFKNFKKELFIQDLIAGCLTFPSVNESKFSILN